MDKVADILKNSLVNVIDLSTRWIDAYDILKQSPEFRADSSLKTLEKVDLLVVYEEHMKQLERAFQKNLHESRSTAKLARQERINRDNFRALLDNLVAEGKIHAKSKWCDLYATSFQDRSEYQEMLGQAGSSPLDLFRDKVEELDDVLYEQRKFIMDFMDSVR